MIEKASEKADECVVYVIDGDKSVREGLGRLLRSVGLQVELFDAPEAFLAFDRPEIPGCLILDVRLRSMNGLRFQQDMVQMGLRIPIVFVTGFGDIEMSVRAMKCGAVDFLEKPFRDQDILDAVNSALVKDRERMARERNLAETRSAYRSLTPREREVLALVLGGLMSKQIAAEIGVSAITVKIHRGQIMKKMGVRSIATLALKAAALGIAPTP